MYVNEDPPAVVFAQPRVASRSLAEVCINLGLKQVGSHHSFEQDIPEGTQVLSGVRNHWDILVSWFFKQGETTNWQSTLPRWLSDVRDGKTHANRSWVKTPKLFWKFRPSSTFIFRYETMQEDLHRFFEGVGLDMNDLEEFPWIKDTVPGRSDRDYRQHYTDESRQLVYDIYGEEIEELGYFF